MSDDLPELVVGVPVPPSRPGNFDLRLSCSARNMHSLTLTSISTPIDSSPSSPSLRPIRFPFLKRNSSDLTRLRIALARPTYSIGRETHVVRKSSIEARLSIGFRERSRVRREGKREVLEGRAKMSREKRSSVN